MRHQRILEQQTERKLPISKRYNREELEKLGAKNITVQGMQEMLDINKLVKRITPEMVKALREKQLNGNYGVQENDTIREVLIKANALQKDFASLPALVREHFGNDEFEYNRFITANKNDKYALVNLAKDITKSEKYSLAVAELKKQDKAAQDAILQKQKELADLIKEAVNPAPSP